VALGAKLADLRNEEITHTALVTGTYVVRVSAENGTVGEYVLDPSPLPATDLNSRPLAAPNRRSGSAGVVTQPRAIIAHPQYFRRSAEALPAKVACYDELLESRGNSFRELLDVVEQRLSAVDHGALLQLQGSTDQLPQEQRDRSTEKWSRALDVCLSDNQLAATISW
jgi:hypothetical protein